MKALCLLGIVILLHSMPAVADTVMDRIISASGNGELTESQSALYMVYSVVNTEALPPAFTDGVEPVRCGTPALHEVSLMLDRVTAPVREEILDLLARPGLSGPEYTYDSPSGHFKIHWTDTGADATNLTYVQNVADYNDYSWEIECDSMLYFHPPPDNNVGGDNKYDIYIKEISALGYTSCSGEFHPPDSTHSCSASHIVICRGISTGGLCQVTCSHEFQHACQMSYDYQEPTWFMENCAVWMEDEVYDDVNDYVGYLTSGDNPIRRPWYDIRSGAMYWYGGTIWARYIGLRFDDVTAVREVWENCAATTGINMLPAQSDMFENHGLTWEQAFMEYACWRWFVKTHWYSGCGMFDEEATMWGNPYVFASHNHTSLPASGDEISSSYDPDTYGIVWIKVKLENYQNGWVEMQFDGRDGFEWNLGAILWSEAGDHAYSWYDCDPATGEKTIAVPTTGWDYVIFVPAFMDETSITHYYEYNITYETGIEEGTTTPSDLGLRVSSNPLAAGGFIQFDVPAATTAQLDVFDLCGRKVSSLYNNEVDAGTHSVSFNGGLTQGTYFLRLYAANQIETAKVVITR